MVTSNLILHRGAREVTLDELDQVEAPPPTATWFPIRHSRVLEATTAKLAHAGFEVERSELALSRDNARFFGTLDLKVDLAPDVGLSVGIRNSIDKSFPIGFACGNRCFVCDNLAFSSEFVVSRKHTRFGERRFTDAIAKVVSGLPQYCGVEARRIQRFQATELTDDAADSLLLRAYEQKLVSSLTLPRVIERWRNPPQEAFRPRTVWSLLNAFTGALHGRSRTAPAEYAALTIRLMKYFDGDAPRTVAAQA